MDVLDKVQVYILDEKGRVASGSGRHDKVLKNLKKVFVLVDDWSSVCDAQLPCIIFSHVEDIASSNDLSNSIASLLRRGDALLILYSGGGGGGVFKKMENTLIRSHENENVCIVGREVPRQGALNIKEIKKVKREAKKSQQGISFEDHTCLRSGNNSYLAALSFLCMGYLAAHNDENIEGLSNLPSDLKKNVVENREKVKYPEKYWKEALDESRKVTLRNIRKEVGVEKLQKDSCIYITVKKIYEYNYIDDLKMVRRTHSETIKHLRG
jgi:hypothetical protein